MRPHENCSGLQDPPAMSKRKSPGTQQLGDRNKRCAKEVPLAARNPFAIASRPGAQAMGAVATAQPIDEDDDVDDVEAQILAAQKAARALRDQEAAKPKAPPPPATPRAAVGSGGESSSAEYA